MRDKCGADLILKYDNQKKAGLNRSIKAVEMIQTTEPVDSVFSQPADE